MSRAKKAFLFILSAFNITTVVNSQTTFDAKAAINTSTGANSYVIGSGELSGDTNNDNLVTSNNSQAILFINLL